MKNPVSPEQIVSDFSITLDILGALKTNPEIPFKDIEVITKNGCVTLRGNLKCVYQKNATGELVENIGGVKKLKNMIAINNFSNNVLFSSYSAN